VAEAIAPPVETETMMIPHRTTPAAAATPAAARARTLAGLLALAALSMAAGCAVLHADDPGRAQAPPAWRVEPVFAIRANSGGESPGRGYFTLGEYYEGAAGWDHAAQAYRQAIALDPGYVEALNALGVLLARTGRADEAEGLLRRAVALAPTRASLHNNLGYLLLQAGRVPEAALELQAAVGADEHNEIARSNLRMARARLEICNGNGVPGMAALVGRLLASQGLPASRLANEPPFSRQRTVVQYRTGHADAARRVAGLLPANARLEASLAGAAPSDVRVVLGRDWMAGAACAQRERCTQVSVAMATTGLQ
jgi:tetratricopeptide (TPR) repeat protein